MKIALLLLPYFLGATSLFAQNNSVKINKSLLKQLHRMELQDQKCRNEYDKLTTGKNQNDSALIENAIGKMKRTDSLNYFQLENIFKKYGYPNYDLVGASGDLYFWLLVQHQDDHLQFQDSVLTAMKVEVDSGKSNGALYAYLLDRVKINSGQLQVYGTQTRMNADSTSYEPFPCVDPENLNTRRKNVGLGPIEKYLEGINKEYLPKKK